MLKIFKSIFLFIFRILCFDYLFFRKKNTVTVFMFHQVNDDKKIYYNGVPIKTFELLCQYIKKNYEVISFSKLNDCKKGARPLAIITFDDGHKDILDNAYPILSKLNLPFNINIDTEILRTGKPQDFVKIYDILNSGNINSFLIDEYMDSPITISNSKPIEIENKFTSILTNLSKIERRNFILKLEKETCFKESNYSKMLNIEDLKFLATKNVEIGSHSHTHSILTKLNKKELELELLESKLILENIVNKDINIFAYPNGIFNNEIRDKALEVGYRYLLETGDEVNNLSIDNLEKKMKRINQYHSTIDEALFHTYGLTKKMKKVLKYAK